MASATNSSSPASSLGAHQQFLAKFSVGDLLQTPQELWWCKDSDSVEEVLNTLRRRRILSVPVWSDETNTWVGVVNLFDIGTAVAFQKLFAAYDDQQLDQISEEMWTAASNMEIMSAPIGSLVGISEESKTVWTFGERDDLRDLLNVFSKGVHRVLVRFEGKNALAPAQVGDSYVRLLTQTDVVRFLKANTGVGCIGDCFRRSLGDCGAGKRGKVVTLSHKSSALTGFQRMTLHDVSALPVVDDDGRVVATLSSSDLRGTHRDTFRNVLLPVLDFLKTTRGVAHDNVTAQLSDTLGEVTDRMLSGRVHRAWLVDEEGQPQGAVTLTDIINQFSPYPVEKM